MELSKKELEDGYSSTGYVPEDECDLSKIAEYEKHEKEEKAIKKKYAKMFGMKEEEEYGGFIERNNYMDRM